MASSSYSTADSRLKKYDVFLSFRGEDTRKKFTSWIRGALRGRGLNVFIDDEMNRGDEIKPSLLKVIEESMVSVIIFSEGYASSKWCLEELLKILECRGRFRQVVVPVFYHVDPSNVRHQTGAFGDLFAELVGRCKDKRQGERWRNALTEAANISGWTVNGERDEHSVGMDIVGNIFNILVYPHPDDEKELVGAQTIAIIDCMINSMLHTELRNVHVIGIWGMGGIGKTTIAEAVFNKVNNRFDGSYFSPSIREESGNPNGLRRLREELFSTILDNRLSNINATLNKRRLGHKSVVIVFDDVTDYSQIECLIGDFSNLGSGSRIIITTRDKQVLKNCRVDDQYIYMIEGLSRFEALKLFRWYAFRQNSLNIGCYELSKRVVEYASGNPLALKVLGSYLFDEPKHVWESAISKLEIIPHKNIQAVLKISYDGLDEFEKNIFLDIACFFKGESKDFVEDFLNACGFFAEIGMNKLFQICLITISSNEKITMHDLIQQMGREIVRQESTEDPGRRSRLWHCDDIYSVFEENMGTEAIEGICLDMSQGRDIINLQPDALKRMCKLRFFKFYNSHYEENNSSKVYFPEDLHFIFRKLRYLCWHGCPFKSLQPNLHARSFVIKIDMHYSNIEQIWTSGIKLDYLKHLDFSYSKHLRKIEDLSSAPNLESLILEGCTSLLEIPSSIQFLNKLAILNLRHCRSLHSLPSGICLRSLRKLILSFCSNLKTFPEISKNIKELLIDATAIEELPPSVENLSRLVILDLNNCLMLERLPSNIYKLKFLEHLNLSGCSKLGGLPQNLGNLDALKLLEAERLESEVPLSFANLHFLRELNLTDCCIEKLPDSLGQLSSLQILLLGKNNFESIPSSIIDLSKLSDLDLGHCERLQSLPKLPCHLRNIDLYNCISLEPSSSLSILFSKFISHEARFNFCNCFKRGQSTVREIVEHELQKVHCMRMENFENPFKTKPYLRFSSCICLPGTEIPDFFISQNTDSFVTLHLTGALNHSCRPTLPNLVMCVVVEFQQYHNEGQGLILGYDCTFRNQDEDILEQHRGTLKGWDYGTGPNYVNSDHTFFVYDLSLDMIGYSVAWPISLTVQFYVEDLCSECIGCCIIKRCGVHCMPSQQSTFLELEKDTLIHLKFIKKFSAERTTLKILTWLKEFEAVVLTSEVLKFVKEFEADGITSQILKFLKEFEAELITSELLKFVKKLELEGLNSVILKYLKELEPEEHTLDIWKFMGELKTGELTYYLSKLKQEWDARNEWKHPSEQKGLTRKLMNFLGKFETTKRTSWVRDFFMRIRRVICTLNVLIFFRELEPKTLASEIVEFLLGLETKTPNDYKYKFSNSFEIGCSSRSKKNLCPHCYNLDRYSTDL